MGRGTHRLSMLYPELFSGGLQGAGVAGPLNAFRKCHTNKRFDQKP
jgi:hypothetical protein